MNKNKEAYNKYMREYMLARYKKRRELGIEQLGGKCVKCSSVKELQFDHIDPSTKLFTLAKGSSYSQKRWDTELAKCQLLCQNCHDFKTIGENGWKPAKGTHGTLSSYRYCKCDICKAAKREYANEYNKTHVRKRDRK